jgi:hypothetical protein
MEICVISTASRRDWRAVRRICSSFGRWNITVTLWSDVQKVWDARWGVVERGWERSWGNCGRMKAKSGLKRHCSLVQRQWELQIVRIDPNACQFRFVESGHRQWRGRLDRLFPKKEYFFLWVSMNGQIMLLAGLMFCRNQIDCLWNKFQYRFQVRCCDLISKSLMDDFFNLSFPHRWIIQKKTVQSDI